MEEFNPALRNLVNLGKSYEKSVSGNIKQCTAHAGTACFASCVGSTSGSQVENKPSSIFSALTEGLTCLVYTAVYYDPHPHCSSGPFLKVGGLYARAVRYDRP
ncbi:hypothetical protein GOODEAATRI_026738, partial [Goodea atripinnis]